MYKILILFILVASSVTDNVQLFKNRSYINIVENKVSLTLCPECINEAAQAIDALLNIIIDKGIVGTCGDLCGALANKTGSQTFGIICDLACEAVGIDEFNRMLITMDIDPIYYCELAKLCPINDQGDAKFINFEVTPHIGHTETEFIVDCSFTTKNGTGTGTIRIELVSSIEDYLIEAKKPGTYTEKISLTAFNLYCNSTNGGCEKWPVGTYNISAQICNGECGSKHPHSSTYDFSNTTFVVTK